MIFFFFIFFVEITKIQKKIEKVLQGGLISSAYPPNIFLSTPLDLSPHYSTSMVTVQQALDAYSVRTAKTIRTQCFFTRLGKSSSTKSRQKAVMKARDDFFNGNVTEYMLKHKFGEEVVKGCLDKSLTDCFARAEKRLSSDPNLPTCCVCLERGANYYVIHGGSAHKCVCAICAMTIALKPRPRCPVSRDDITLLVNSAKMSYGCVCSETKCERLLVVEERFVNKSRVYRAMVECHMCSLESFEAQFCRVYTLFS